MLLEGKQFVICNVYAPTQNHVKEQLEFLNELNAVLEEFKDCKLVIAGDFNIIQNPDLDKYKGENEKPGKVARSLEELKSYFNLSDIWRVHNPNLRRYTWRRRNPLQQSRLDYWLVSETLNNSVQLTDIGIAFKSDHNAVHLALNVNNEAVRGKGYWKLNNSLLNDEDYVMMIVNKIESMVDELNQIADKRLAWDFF